MKTPLKSDEPLPTQGASFNLHAYAVWWHPMCDTGFDCRGVHAGGTSAWAYIMSWLPNGQYGGSKVRLRRFPNVESAIEGYTQEFRQQGPEHSEIVASLTERALESCQFEAWHELRRRFDEPGSEYGRRPFSG
jgi:hypothetical protein